MASKLTATCMSDDNWRAESDARTLVEAEKIKSDKGRHKAAVAHASQEAQHLQKITTKPSAPAAKPAPKAPPKAAPKPVVKSGRKK